MLKNFLFFNIMRPIIGTPAGKQTNPETFFYIYFIISNYYTPVMKKRLLLALLVSLIRSYGYSQEIAVYAKEGINLNSTTTDLEGSLWRLDEEAIEKSLHLGFRFGAGLDIGITKMFSIAPELLFTQKGLRFLIEEGWWDTRTKITHSFIELPVLARAKFGIGNLKAYINAGPHIGCWTGGYYITGGTISNEPFTEKKKFRFKETNKDDEIYFKGANRWEFGLNFGGGLMWELGPGSLMFDLRYAMGLTHLFHKDWDDYSRTFGISLGYFLNLKNTP